MHRVAQALTMLVKALAATGQHEQATQIARSITNPFQQTQALALTPAQLLQARAERERWRAAVAAALREVDLLALATVPFFPPRMEAATRSGYLALTSPVNLAGFPALALPVPTGQRLPASLQLIGGPNAEALLLATGAMIEAAL